MHDSLKSSMRKFVQLQLLERVDSEGHRSFKETHRKFNFMQNAQMIKLYILQYKPHQTSFCNAGGIAFLNSTTKLCLLLCGLSYSKWQEIRNSSHSRLSTVFRLQGCGNTVSQSPTGDLQHTTNQRQGRIQGHRGKAEVVQGAARAHTPQLRKTQASQGWSMSRSSHTEQPSGSSKHQARVDNTIHP